MTVRRGLSADGPPVPEGRSQGGCAGFRRLPRRAALQVGSLGGLGLSLGDLLGLESARAARASTGGPHVGEGRLPERIRGVIQINLQGGFPHHESFDPKPEAPVECRGSFGVTKTNTGEVFSDNFPKTAAIADKLAVVRTVVGKVPDHGLATYHLFKAYTPTTVIDYPTMGSIVSHELGGRGELPPYIAIPTENEFARGTGFLSSTFGAFELNADPGQAGFAVRDLALPAGITAERFDRRLGLRAVVQDRIRQAGTDPVMLDTMDDFYGRAHTLLTSPDSQRARGRRGLCRGAAAGRDGDRRGRFWG